MMYILIIWTLFNSNAQPIKVAAYESKALCEDAAKSWGSDMRVNYAKCLPIESRSSVIESAR